MEGSFARDALSVSWSGMYAYAFPPPVLHLVLQKVAQEHCTLILTAPFASRQSCYRLLKEHFTDIPRELPVIPKMSTQKRGQMVHPDQKT